MGTGQCIDPGTKFHPLILLSVESPSITYAEDPTPFLNDPSHTAIAVSWYNALAVFSLLSDASKILCTNY
jgi:hypothetical protein